MAHLERYQLLASKWLDGTISKEELAEFAAWYDAHPDQVIEIPEFFAANEEELKRRIFEQVENRIAPSQPKRTFYKYAAIAAALVLAFLCGFMVWHRTNNDSVAHIVGQQHDISPGGNKAMLNLANGQVVVLDSLSVGEVIELAGVRIRKMADGQVIHEMVNTNHGDEPADFVTISTPRGGQYGVTLPDGTMVWLNSATSLRYPTKFDHVRREVQLLHGEAFFEVTQLKEDAHAVPFIVHCREQEVRVLGTQFNISAYDDDESMHTTLVEGSIQLSHEYLPGTRLLKPGEQLRIVNQGKTIQVSEVDTEVFTAWKNGHFYFNDADIYDIMRQFSRWYDIDVHYGVKPANDLYVGKIPRSITLATALDILQIAGINFMISERQLTIVSKQ